MKILNKGGSPIQYDSKPFDCKNHKGTDNKLAFGRRSHKNVKF